MSDRELAIEYRALDDLVPYARNDVEVLYPAAELVVSAMKTRDLDDSHRSGSGN